MANGEIGLILVNIGLSAKTLLSIRRINNVKVIMVVRPSAD
jgi:hypothetical protein